MNDRKIALDALLSRWGSSNALDNDEVLALRNIIAARIKDQELDPKWWKECLSAGLEPMKASLKQLRPTFIATMRLCFTITSCSG